MQEIKCRVWFENEMIYSDCAIGEYEFTFDCNGVMVFNVWNDELHKLTPDGDVVYSGFECYTRDIMQYTGLHDINDVEIYEGDIVRIFDYSICDTNGNPKLYSDYVIKFHKGAWRLFIDIINRPLFDESVRNIEVIGNIYENPGLV